MDPFYFVFAVRLLCLDPGAYSQGQEPEFSSKDMISLVCSTM